MFADNFFSWLAIQRQRVIMGSHILIKHNHPSIPGGLPRDETFLRQNEERHYREGEIIFERLKKEYKV
jgi:hypothetical protein